MSRRRLQKRQERAGFIRLIDPSLECGLVPPDCSSPSTITIVEAGSTKGAVAHERNFNNRKIFLDRTLLKNNSDVDDAYGNRMFSHAVITPIEYDVKGRHFSNQ